MSSSGGAAAAMVMDDDLPKASPEPLTSRPLSRRNQNPTVETTTSNSRPSTRKSFSRDLKENLSFSDSFAMPSASGTPHRDSPTGSSSNNNPQPLSRSASSISKGPTRNASSGFSIPRAARGIVSPPPRPTPTKSTSSPRTVTSVASKLLGRRPSLPQSRSTQTKLRQPMSLKAAFKRADEQEPSELKEQESPEDAAFRVTDAFKLAQAEVDGVMEGSPSPAPRTFRKIGSMTMRSEQVTSPTSDQEISFENFDGQSIKSIKSGRNGSPKTPSLDHRPHSAGSHLSQNLVRKPSSLELGKSANQLLHGGRDSPIKSIEAPLDSPAFQNAQPSPEKKFDWNLDNDFTAGDLQISDSPRVGLGRAMSDGLVDRGSMIQRSHERLRQIQELENEAANALLEDSDSSINHQTKLDEVRRLEMEALSRRALATSRLDEIRVRNSESRPRSPTITRRSSSLNHHSRSTTPVHEEFVFISTPNRGGGSFASSSPVASIKNSPIASLRTSVEVPRPSDVSGKDRGTDGRSFFDADDSHDLLRRLARATSSSPTPPPGTGPTFGPALEPTSRPVSEHVSDRLSRSEPTMPPPPPSGPMEPTAEPSSQPATESGAVSRSASAPVDAVAEAMDEPLVGERTSPSQDFKLKHTNTARIPREHKRFWDMDARASRDQLAVASANLKRSQSNDPLDKRRSMMTSHSDPTGLTTDHNPADQFVAELKLLAPRDDAGSDKGSVRAPSPAPAEEPNHAKEKEIEAEGETPRSKKPVDPVTLPTPQVSGAYLETPALNNVKSEEEQEQQEEQEKEEDAALAKSPEPIDSGESKPLPRVRRATYTGAPKSSDVKLEESDEWFDIGSSKDQPLTTMRSASVPTRRRARSAAKRRRTIINTAKIPTVKEDLRSILNRNQIDDSTLENFDEILAKTDLDPDELEKVVNDTTMKVKDQLETLDAHENEMQAYERLSKTIQHGLVSIQSARHGIERLEKEVSHAEAPQQQKPSTSSTTATITTTTSNISDANTTAPKNNPPTIPATIPAPEVREISTTTTKQHLPAPMAPIYNDATFMYYSLRIPRLYRRKPHFRFTALGLLLFAAATWYVIESLFCLAYVDPDNQACSVVPFPGAADCDWSPDEPYFPYATPFMLDQWVTGGRGRKVATRVGEEAGDVAAEFGDWVAGHDFTSDDEMYMDLWERRRHRRRLDRRGLVRAWNEPEAYRERFRGWREALRARVEGWESRAFGGDDSGESMSGDEQVF